jgi:hypothetical protein
MRWLIDVSTESEIAAYIFGGMTTMEAPGNGVVGDTKGDIDPANVVEEGGKLVKFLPVFVASRI